MYRAQRIVELDTISASDDDVQYCRDEDAASQRKTTRLKTYPYNIIINNDDDNNILLQTWSTRMIYYNIVTVLFCSPVLDQTLMSPRFYVCVCVRVAMMVYAAIVFCRPISLPAVSSDKVWDLKTAKSYIINACRSMM